MKLVGFSGAVYERYRFELGVFKLDQTALSGGFCVEALAAKLLGCLVGGTVVDDIISRCELAATIATYLAYLAGWGGSGSFHFRSASCGSNSPNVNTSVAAAMVTYCLPSAMKVMGEAVMFCPR